MTASATQALVTGALTDFGGAMIVVLGSVIGIGVAFLVFNIAWRKAKGSAR